MKTLVWVKDELAAKQQVDQYYADLGFLGSAALYPVYDLQDVQQGWWLLLNGKRVCKFDLGPMDHVFGQADQQIADHLSVAASKIDLKVI
jgi:hypothetical protein